MSLARHLVRLYPSPVRTRWGPELEEEIAAAGWRSWPDALWGAADLWLHPATWPATSTTQRWMRSSVLAIATALTGGLLGRSLGEPPGTGATPAAHLALSGSALLAVAGLVLLVPRPRAERATLPRVARCAVSRLGVLSALGVVLVALAWSGTLDHPPPVVHRSMVTCYWAVLVLGSVQGCRALSELEPAALHPPSALRLRLGVLVICSALAGAGATVTVASLSFHGEGSSDFAHLSEGAVLLLLTTALACTMRDLPPTRPFRSRHIRPPRPGRTSGARLERS